MGAISITKLRQAKVSATGKDLALLLVERAGYAGVCALPLSMLAKELGVQRAAVSKLVAALEEYGLVRRVGGGRSAAIAINPRFAFQGTPAEHHRALERWAALNPPELVPVKRTA